MDHELSQKFRQSPTHENFFEHFIEGVTMRDSSRTSASVIWDSFLLRCPRCGIGHTFAGLFKINPICEHCGLQFGRESGESVGGMYINLGAAEMFTVGGFILFHTLFNLPFVPHLIFWVIFNIAFVIIFYRHSRSVWMGIAYLTRNHEPEAH